MAAIWTAPEDEASDIINSLEDFKGRVMRLRACFPMGTDLHYLDSNLEVIVMIPGGVKVRMTDEQVTQRLERMSRLQLNMWEEWLRQLKTLPPGTEVRPDWLNTENNIRIERPVHQKSLIDSLMDRE